MTNELIKREDASQFTDEEFEELNQHLVSDGSRISVSVATNFLALYLEGQTINQIHRQFPQWPKGALLLARFYHNWDKQKDDYVNDLIIRLKDRLSKVKVDVVNHLIDVLAVTHKEYSRDVAIYLQNPTPENLPRNRIKSHREYKEVLATLKEALALGQPTKPDNGLRQPVVNIMAGQGATIQISSEQHETILDHLLEAKKKG